MRWSASALHEHCGFAQVLGKTRKRTKPQRVSMDKGNLFHLYRQHGRTDVPVPREYELSDVDVAEVMAWFELMRSSWVPPEGIAYELAVGLSPVGRYVDVDEPEPHVYAAKDGTPLLTAGRLDAGYPERGVAVVFDSKTGRTLPTPAERNLQLWSLGLAYADKLDAEALRVGLYFARTGEFEWYPSATGAVALDSDEAARRWADVERAALLDETPRPGPHCGSCWERKACEHADL